MSTTIGNISGYNSIQPLQTSQGFVSPAVSDTDGDNDGSRGTKSGGGFLITALQNSLSSVGVGDIGASNNSGATSASSSSASGNDSQQALQNFLQTLLAALQSGGADKQAESGNAGSETSSSTSTGTATTSATSPQAHHHHHGGAGRLEAGVQNLLQELSSSTSSDASNTVTGGDTNSALSSLQSSFSNLLAATGVSGQSATLTGFLQSLSQNLQGVGTAGGVVSAHV